MQSQVQGADDSRIALHRLFGPRADRYSVLVAARRSAQLDDLPVLPEHGLGGEVGWKRLTDDLPVLVDVLGYAPRVAGDGAQRH